LVCAIALLCSSVAALDRSAFTFINYDLEVKIDPAQHGLAVTGNVILRNDSSSPQKNAVLQISSSLNWIAIKLMPGERAVQYVVHSYQSDVDHTGALSEAVVTLPKAVAPGGEVELEVTFSGQVMPDATRLERLGTPKETAAATEWDQISPEFTALRGVGYMAWYPLAMESVSLKDGRDYALALGEWKQRQAASKMEVLFVSATRVNLIANATSEGKAATAAISEPAEILGSRTWSPMGTATPFFSLSAYAAKPVAVAGVTVNYFPGHENVAKRLADAATQVQTLLPRRQISVLELPAGDAPFAIENFLFTPLAGMNAQSAEVTLAFPLGYLASPRPWISEGWASFSQAYEREQQADTAAALDYLRVQLPALMEEEKENRAGQTNPKLPLNSAETSLIAGNDELLYRSKAMYVWWMLRDLLGEKVLRGALEKYRAEDDRDSAYVQRLLEQEARAQKIFPKMDLEKFFDDWVYRDRGLPDFSVKSTYTRKLLGSPEGENYMVTVVIANSGNAGAEVPVTVEAGEREVVTKRVVVAARAEASLRIPTINLPKTVSINDGSVPESDTSNNSATVAPPSE
jgi:hypothetical protein